MRDPGRIHVYEQSPIIGCSGQAKRRRQSRARRFALEPAPPGGLARRLDRLDHSNHSNIGAWMQSVGAAWLMTSLTPSPLLVALMQTAASLPVFLVGLPAGALADVVDRRKLLLVTET